MRFFRLASVLVVGMLISSALLAGELFNDTKEVISVQAGTRNAKTGEFTWTKTIKLEPGKYAKLTKGEWYRHDTHVRDAKTTWSLPGKIDPDDRRFYFFLFGNEVRIDVTRK